MATNKDGFEVGRVVDFDALNKHQSELRAKQKSEGPKASKNAGIESLIAESLYKSKVRLKPRDLESLAADIVNHFTSKKAKKQNG